MRTILIADDDPHIREILAFCLEKAGFRVLQASDGAAALNVATQHRPDLLVLDIGMPEMDGLDVCRQLRKTSEIPVLFLSARDDEIDRVVGLELGADDYVTKPFSPRELVARVQAILKRATHSVPAAEPPEMLRKNGLSLDAQAWQACWQDTPVPLTHTEFLLLAALMRHPSMVFSRDRLMDAAYDHAIVSDRTIDSHVRRIRAKFAAAGGSSVIETLHGIGYRLGSCA